MEAHELGGNFQQRDFIHIFRRFIETQHRFVSKASYNHSMDIMNEKYGTKSMFGRNKSYFYRWGSMKIAGEDSTCGTKKSSQYNRICPNFSVIDK